jgi:hypothetical protein
VHASTFNYYVYLCRVMRHVPICGYNYDPPTPEPKDEFIIGERYSPVNPPESRPTVT